MVLKLFILDNIHASCMNKYISSLFSFFCQFQCYELCKWARNCPLSYSLINHTTCHKILRADSYTGGRTFVVTSNGLDPTKVVAESFITPRQNSRIEKNLKWGKFTPHTNYKALYENYTDNKIKSKISSRFAIYTPLL